jgi:hypothetical protein
VITAWKIRDLERFCDGIQSQDRIALNLGLSSVYGLGIVVGGYEWNDHLGDVDGWDIAHIRRVHWFWKRPDYSPLPIQAPKLKRGTTQRLSSPTVLRIFDEQWDRAGQPVPDETVLPNLPSGQPETISVDEIGEALFERGIGAASISETIARIEDIKRLANWYSRLEETPSESETIAHLVVPLLQTLGWTPQRLAVEWNRVDLALFDAVPRSDDHLNTVVEVKKMEEACLSAKSQAEGYASKKGREKCRRLIVTDGLRYGVFIRQNDGLFPDHPQAYMNLRRLIREYPILRSPAERVENNGAAKAMELMSANLRL